MVNNFYVKVFRATSTTYLCPRSSQLKISTKITTIFQFALFCSSLVRKQLVYRWYCLSWPWKFWKRSFRFMYHPAQALPEVLVHPKQTQRLLVWLFQMVESFFSNLVAKFQNLQLWRRVKLRKTLDLQEMYLILQDLQDKADSTLLKVLKKPLVA